ncbi:MAG: hypothetical protein ACQES1_11445, partial [Bacteroidota bacterium]
MKYLVFTLNVLFLFISFAFGYIDSEENVILYSESGDLRIAYAGEKYAVDGFNFLSFSCQKTDIFFDRNSKTSIQKGENIIPDVENPNYIYDWGDKPRTTEEPEIEMVRSLSDCSTTSSAYTLCEGEDFTVTHGTTGCCDSDARLYYYNGYTGNGQYGSYGVDQYTSSVT